MIRLAAEKICPAKDGQKRSEHAGTGTREHNHDQGREKEKNEGLLGEEAARQEFHGGRGQHGQNRDGVIARRPPNDQDVRRLEGEFIWGFSR